MKNILFLKSFSLCLLMCMVTGLSLQTAQPSPTPAEASSPPTFSSSTSFLNSAYVRDVDLGNGQRAAWVSSVPLNYRATDGSWQPIDPSFQPISGGYTNPTNLLKISTTARQAALGLESAGQKLAWVPEALILQSSNGQEITLAHLLPATQAGEATLSGDGRTLRYPSSWSLDGLREEIVSGPGSVEESLIFSTPPTLSGKGTSAGILALRATLHLPEGAILFANGKPHTAAFDTEGEVEVRDTTGQTLLILNTPYAFEQTDPTTRIAATYHLTPRDATTWQVEIQTPEAWWDGRQYPVVLDPLMTVHQASLAGTAYSEPGGCSYSEVNEFLPGDLYRGSAVSLGRNPQCPGVFRAVVRFGTDTLPILPMSAVVQNVELFAAAAGGYFRTFSAPGYTPVRSSAAATVEVRQVLDEWAWNAYGGVTWGSYATSGALGSSESFMILPPEDRSGGGWPVHFTIPASVYQTWLTGANYGLELRLVDEAWTCASCGNFVEIPEPPNWTSEDVDTDPEDLWPDGGGFMLVIHYQAPELTAGITYGYNPDYLLPTDTEITAFTEHHFGLPDISSTWSAVAVKGISSQGFVKAAGHPGLRVDNYLAFAGDQASNYILMRGNPGLQELEIPPFKPTSEGELEPTEYVTEVKAGIPLNNGNPIQAGQTVNYALEMNSKEIIRVFELNLVEGTNVRVQIQGFGGLNARLFPPAEEFEVFGKSYLDAVPASKSLTPVESSGTWGLVVEFPYNPTQSETGNFFTISANVVVIACTADQQITDQGCWEDPVPTPALFCAAVGPYWIRSEDAFVLDPDTQEYYNTSPGVMMGWGNCSSAIGTRWVLVTNEVRFKNTAPYSLYWEDGNTVWLVYKPGASKIKQWFWYGDTDGNPNTSDTNYGYLVPENYLSKDDLALPFDDFDAVQASIKINVSLQQAEGQATITREVETRPESLPSVLETFTFSIEWILQADVTLGATQSHAIELVSGPNFAEVGAMELHLDYDQWEMDFHAGAGGGQFGLLRSPAKIAHTEQMGGAWKPVQAVILPYGEALPGEGTGGNTIACPGTCLDVRHPTLDDVFTVHRSWELPDIEINGQANMMAFSKPGSLDIFSTDQPNAPDDTTVPFSFKTVGGFVKTYRGVCPDDPSGQLVQIIQGSTHMSLPGLGDENGAFGGIQADFTLCQDALHNVSLSYSGLPIPVGSTGLFINRIGGTITLAPENTEVIIDVDYRSGSGGELTTGTARVTINTEGLFSAQVLNGNLVGIMNYDGYADISWNPMSFSTGLHGWMDLWILHNEVDLNASIWQGQGWQHQYGWLPDDGTTHFAGSLVTRLTIPEGAILSESWFPDIPWEDWTLFSLSLQIGEFHCGECSDGYEYGIQGAFSHAIFTLGYDVGLYVGFESGMDVILGGGQHALVNQYPGLNTLGPERKPFETLLVGGEPVMLPITLAPDPAATEVTWPLTVTAQTSSMLVGLGWENLSGQPRLTILRPDGVEITPENAADYDVHLSMNEHGIFYGIEDPTYALWTAKITNIAADDYWHLIYFANNQTPEFNLLTPDTAGISWDPNYDGEYTIEWEVPTPFENDEYLTVSLYYTKTVPGVLTPTVGLITDMRMFYRGFYTWDMSYLGEGTYQVWGVVRNVGSDDYFNPPSTLTEREWLGITRATAPGSIELVDEEPPVIPTNLHLIPLDEAFLACWDPAPDHDLAGYRLTYIWDSVSGATYVRYLRVVASVPYSEASGALQQCARIGNLNVGHGTAVMVAAYDNSNNFSADSNYVTGLVENAPGGGPAVSGLTAADQPDHSIILNWTHGSAAGYRLYYAADMPAGPQQPYTGADEGASPILLGPVGTVTLHGLPVGHRIHFAIQGFDAAGRPGPVSEDVAVWLSDGQDTNDNGLPDDWEFAYGLQAMGDDPDQDCLSNLRRSPLGLIIGGEFWEGTNPLSSDTDGDGYTDGEEVNGDSDPLDPASIPAERLPVPRLSLNTHALLFRTGTENASPPPQEVEVTNTGSGTITPTLSVDATWLTVDWENGIIRVSVNSTGLAHGSYTATITVGGYPGVCTTNAPQTIVVVLGVFQGELFQYELYLPITKRQ